MLPRRSTLSGSDYERQTSDRDLRGTISAAGATARDRATSRRPRRSAWSALAARADRPECAFHLRTQASHKLALAQRSEERRVGKECRARGSPESTEKRRIR